MTNNDLIAAAILAANKANAAEEAAVAARDAALYANLDGAAEAADLNAAAEAADIAAAEAKAAYMAARDAAVAANPDLAKDPWVTTKSQAAATLGSSKSERKATAVRENGRKGGRSPLPYTIVSANSRNVRVVRGVYEIVIFADWVTIRKNGVEIENDIAPISDFNPWCEREGKVKWSSDLIKLNHFDLIQETLWRVSDIVRSPARYIDDIRIEDPDKLLVDIGHRGVYERELGIE